MKLTNWLNHTVKVFMILCLSVAAHGQTINLGLDEVLEKARANYPLIKQKDLLTQTAALNVENLSKGYLPQFAVNGQATYQSDVTRVDVPLPNIRIDAPEKDQYKIYGELTQLIYDGGQISAQKQIQEYSKRADDQQVEVELYKVRQRVSSLYVGILYLDAQLRQINLIREDINTGIRRTEAQVNNGVAFRSNLNVLRAEMLKTDQREQELEGSREGLINALSVFINQPLTDSVVLAPPAAFLMDSGFTVNTKQTLLPATASSSDHVPDSKQTLFSATASTSDHVSSDHLLTNRVKYSMSISESDTQLISRPELKQFADRSALLGLQQSLVTARNRPKTSLFVQGGYGRPALNLLKNQFDWYYIGGIRLSWNLGGMYTARRDRQLIGITQTNIDLQQQAFVVNTRVELASQFSEITKLQKMIATDARIIDLRNQVREASKAQLDNGVITASDYLREINAADQAAQTKITHEIQLLQAKINYQNTSGKF